MGAFPLYQSIAETGRHLILVPHTEAFFMLSQPQTAGHKMAAFMERAIEKEVMRGVGVGGRQLLVR